MTLSALLWRCPICKVNDTINHNHRLLRADRVSCSNCESAWDLHRIIGGTDYRLKAIAGPMTGSERLLAEWYDMMREGFELIPIKEPGNYLKPGEELFLKGNASMVVVLRKDPRFEKAISQRIPTSIQTSDPETPIIDLGPTELFLTNHKVVVFNQADQFSLPLNTLRAVDIAIDRFLILRHEYQMIEIIEFERESPLKWRAYLEAVLSPIIKKHNITVRMAFD